MIWKGKGVIKIEKGEPSFRTCWKCNSAHQHLKKVNTLHCCWNCGKNWIFDKFFTDFKNDKQVDDYFKKLGLKEDESTTKIDGGYRIMKITLKCKKESK